MKKPNIPIADLDQFEDAKIRKFMEEENKMAEWLNSLSEEQLAYCIDSAIYNGAMLGYLINAAKILRFKSEDILSLIRAYKDSLGDYKANDAEKIFFDWWNKNIL